MEAPTVILSPAHHWVNSPYFDGKNRSVALTSSESSSAHPKRLWAASRLNKLQLPSAKTVSETLPVANSLSSTTSSIDDLAPHGPLKEDFLQVSTVSRHFSDRSPTSPNSPAYSPLKRRLFKPHTIESALTVAQQSPDLELSKLIETVSKSLDTGTKLELVSDGMGGTYFIREAPGKNSRILAVFKPRDEEINAPNNPKGNNKGEMNGPGVKEGILIGEGYIRELAAYLLDHEHFAGVPPTTIVKYTQQKQTVKRTPNTAFDYNNASENKTEKVGSLQLYCDHDSSCEDISANSFPTQEVHKIGILDIRLANTDRNEANILVSKKKSNHSNSNTHSTPSDAIELIPIDHGLVLPSALNDVWFDWLHWPQAKQPFDLETKNYISRLDPDADCALLRRTGQFDEASLRILKICSLFLKKGAAGGLTLFDLGGLMSRRSNSQPSVLETVITEAERMSDGTENKQSFFDCLNIQLDLLVSNRTMAVTISNCSTM